MPFKIIRNDITKAKADIIVNTANPKPLCGSGTDYAIYQAAGADKLLEERKSIGDIKRGDIAVTKAYDLSAKYIIHTVGPVWTDGNAGEFDILTSCYAKSLQKAVELGSESIAFPLISTGVYGFPKDKALQIAVNVFSKFLLEHDMQIILVVFDKKSFQLSGRLVGEIDAYIDANYVTKKRSAEYPRRRRIESDVIGSSRLDFEEELLRSRTYEADWQEVEESICMPPMEAEFSVKASVASLSLEEQLDQIGMSFHEKLFELIDKSGIDNKDVWKRANLDRKHFSKIQCDAKYHPKKKTVMALCIALELTIDEAKDLMARADWAFSPSSKVDLIVQKAIIDKQYDIMQLNVTLFKYTSEILGV